MEKLQKYSGWVTTLIMVCVWLVTILWYGKKIDANTAAVNQFNKFMIEQVELNGGFVMYMKMDDE